VTYAELRKALRIMGLRERCTIKELKARHRELVKRHHPDKVAGCNQEAIRDVNAAYRVLLDYVSEYRFSFAEEEFYEQNPDELLRRQFMDDM